ncbi:MAG: hypothetical protein ACFFD2_20005 [Promethearchaeota archaeon]
MRIELFQPTIEGEARLLLLIERFSRGKNALEGRTKLAKLDFFLRYPIYFRRALELRGFNIEKKFDFTIKEDIEAKMVRYRYGPWDPAYFAILGRLIGKNLIIPVPIIKGIGYKATAKGRKVSNSLYIEPVWEETTAKIELLKKYLNLKGYTLKKFIYDNFPEIASREWGESL